MNRRLRTTLACASALGLALGVAVSAPAAARPVTIVGIQAAPSSGAVAYGCALPSSPQHRLSTNEEPRPGGAFSCPLSAVDVCAAAIMKLGAPNRADHDL